MPKKLNDLLRELQGNVNEIFPWDLSDRLLETPDLLIVDVREPYEFETMHIPNSLLVPRGILESACEYGYEETVPRLVEARSEEIVVVCRSGNRSLLAAHTMKILGYGQVSSLKTGLRGWNDYEQPLVDGSGAPVSVAGADDYFSPKVSEEQLGGSEP